MGRPKSRKCKIEWKPSKKGSNVGSIMISYVNNRYSTGVSGIKKSHLTKDNLLNNLFGKDEIETHRLNSLILNKKREIESIIDEAINEGIDDIKEYISHFYNRKKNEGASKLKVAISPVSFFAKEYVENKLATLQFKSPRSKERYVQFLQGIEEYEREKCKKAITNVNRKWVNDLIFYLGTPRIEKITVLRKGVTYQQKKKRCKKNTTLNRFVKDLWYFLKWVGGKYKIEFDDSLFEKGILLNQPSPTDNLFSLTSDQLISLIQYNPETQQEEKAKDLFLFCCLTGLSYGDAVSLCSNHVLADGLTIDRSRLKTDIDYKTIMTDLAKAIFQKYGGDFRKKFPTTQRVNINLRKMLKKIPEFNSKVDFIEWTVFNNHLSKEEIKVKKPLYEVLKFHSSRKTFITQVCDLPSINMVALCRMVGWTTNSNSVNHYIDRDNILLDKISEDFNQKIKLLESQKI